MCTCPNKLGKIVLNINKLTTFWSPIKSFPIYHIVCKGGLQGVVFSMSNSEALPPTCTEQAKVAWNFTLEKCYVETLFFIFEMWVKSATVKLHWGKV